MNHKERKFYKENLMEVLHTTLNPDQPGMVKIYLVPAKYQPLKTNPSIVILNGKDIIPINLSWTILLAVFIKEVDRFQGQPITGREIREIVEVTTEKVYRIYKTIKKEELKREIKEDLSKILSVLMDVSEGKEQKVDIGQLSIKKYAKNMKAPHRMDLMLSSVEKDGKWNCTQNCSHCRMAEQEYGKVKELTTDQWKKIIDKCRKACISQLTFTGADPIKREDLVELVEYSRWFYTRLNTNGVGLTQKLCKELKDASLDDIQIKLYSSDEEVHNEIVGGKTYKRTIQGIKNAIKVGLPITIKTPISTKNKEYTKTLEFLNDLGVRNVECSGFITYSGPMKTEEERIEEDELYEILEEAKEYAHENGMEIKFTSPGWLEKGKLNRLKLDTPICGACLTNMAIAPNGEVVPCNKWLNSKAGLGNMLKTKWEDIWDNPQTKKRRTYSTKETGKCPLMPRRRKKRKSL